MTHASCCKFDPDIWPLEGALTSSRPKFLILGFLCQIWTAWNFWSWLLIQREKNKYKFCPKPEKPTPQIRTKSVDLFFSRTSWRMDRQTENQNLITLCFHLHEKVSYDFVRLQSKPFYSHFQIWQRVSKRAGCSQLNSLKPVPTWELEGFNGFYLLAWGTYML